MTAVAHLLNLPAPAIVGNARPDSRDVAGDIIRRQGAMENERSNYDNIFQEIADYMLPRVAQFTIKPLTTPNLRNNIYDSTAVLACDRFSAAFDSMLTPRTSQWHMLKPQNENLADDIDVKRWCDDTTKRLFDIRYSPSANFATQIHEVYSSLGAFGTGGLFIESIPGEGISYKSCNLSGLYFAVDFQGKVNYVHYKQDMTAEQAAQRFGVENLPRLVAAKLDGMAARPDDKASYIHCVRPRYDRVYGALGQMGMPFESWWVCQDARQVVGKGGFRTFPYAISRYTTRPGQVYGDSPGMMALADTRMLNIMAQSMIQGAQMAFQPTLLTPDDGIFAALGDDGISAYPNNVITGGVNAQGNPLVHALNLGMNFSPAKEEIQERRQTVNAIFLVTLFQILVDTPTMTATEATFRQQEKGALLAPTTGRQQSELLGPIVEREIDLLARAGMLAPPPDAMREAGGKGYKVEYESPFTRMMRNDATAAVLRTVEALTPLAQIDPSVMDGFNPEEILIGLADSNGVPAKMIRTKDELKALKDGRAQQQQAAQLVTALPAITGGIKDVADAQAAQQKARF